MAKVRGWWVVAQSDDLLNEEGAGSPVDLQLGCEQIQSNLLYVLKLRCFESDFSF